MTRLRRTALLLLLGAVFAPAAEAQDRYLIHAGTLLAVPGEAPETAQSVLVVDGRIEEVRAGYVEAEGATVVDLTDAFVLPGLIDAHVHLASAPGLDADPLQVSEGDLALIAARHARIALQSGFTTVVDLGLSGQPGHENAIFAVRDAVAAGTLAGPRVIAAGTPIAVTGQSRSGSYRPEIDALIDRRSSCNGPEDCRRAVRHQVKRGSDVITFFNTGSLLAADTVERTMTDAEMRAIVTTAHALGRKAIADGHHAAGIAAALAAGADSIDSAHLYGADTFSAFGQDQFLQSHIYGVVRAVGDTRDTMSDGLWGWLPPPLLERFFAIKQRPFAMIAGYEHGLRKLVYASDAGVYPWGDNAHDLVEFVRRGMLPADALRTATVNAAAMLGIAERAGTVEAGRDADLIAVAGDPLADIEAMLSVSFVMRNGIVYRQSGRPSSRPGD